MLIIVLIEKAIHLLRGPVQKPLPMFAGFDVAGVTLVSLATIFGLVFICFLAGLASFRRGGRGSLEFVGPWLPKA